MSFGISLGVISIFLTLAFLGFGIILRIYSYNKVWFNILKTITGIFLFIWFIIFRYSKDVNELINIVNNTAENSLLKSTYYSKVLLLDMCPFMYVAFSFCLIFDWKSKITSYVAIWAMIGSYITIIGSIWTISLESNQTWYEFVFFTSSEGHLYFFIHIVTMTLGTMMFVYCDKYNLKGIINVYYVVVSYMIYIVIMSKALGVFNNVTGTVEYDWIYGEYSNVHKFFGFNDNNWLSSMFISYFLVWVFMNLLICLRFFLSKPLKRFFFFQKMYESQKVCDFSDCWYEKHMLNYYKIFKKRNYK